MASKAYVASMTVAELTSELKKRGLSCRGKKKTLQARLEEALEDEELSESSSEDETEATIRVASAVISQLEGDGTNNYQFGLDNSDTIEKTGENEELVVSIEHSKRGFPQETRTRNGDVEDGTAIIMNTNLQSAMEDQRETTTAHEEKTNEREILPDRADGSDSGNNIEATPLVTEGITQIAVPPNVPAAEMEVKPEEPVVSSSEREATSAEGQVTSTLDTAVEEEPTSGDKNVVEPDVIEKSSTVEEPVVESGEEERTVEESANDEMQVDTAVKEPVFSDKNIKMKPDVDEKVEEPVVIASEKGTTVEEAVPLDVFPAEMEAKPEEPVVTSDGPGTAVEDPVSSGSNSIQPDVSQQSSAPFVMSEKDNGEGGGVSEEPASEKEDEEQQVTPQGVQEPEREDNEAATQRAQEPFSPNGKKQEIKISSPIVRVSEPPTPTLESTPIRSIGIVQQKDTMEFLFREPDRESEANSIAVEPPSPNRDDISFMAEESHMSLSGSAEMEEENKDSTIKEIEMPSTSDNEEEKGPVEKKDSAEEPMAVEEQPPKSEPDTPSSDPATLVSSSVDEANVEGVAGKDSDGKMGGALDQPVGVSSHSALIDSGAIEVDVLVPTVEEDDMSVFSAEAAEAQKLDSNVVSANSMLKRPVTLLKPSDEKQSLLSACEGETTETVGGVLVENESNVESSKKRTISVPEDSEKDKDGSGVPSTKRRRVSTSPKRIQERRRRWGSSSVSRTPTSTHTAISSDVLENIIPDEVKEEVTTEAIANMSALEAVMNYGEDESNKEEEQERREEEPNPRGEQEEEEMKQDEEDILDIGKESSMVDEYEQEWKEKEREREELRKESLKAKHELDTRRRIEARVKARQEREERERPIRRTPSPARMPPSRILHIKYLTRPFTNLQLKDLLQEDGNLLVEGGFWTDRIKSRCIAIYVTMDAAISARNRIHNLKWPRQNPRLLKTEYLTPDQVSEFTNGELEIELDSPSPVVGDENIKVPTVKEVPETKTPPTAVKEGGVVKENKEPQRRDSTLKQRRSTSDTKEEAVQEKPKSMLDNLFRKTKATPAIYWLPLSEKEASEKEAERKSLEAERNKRREERRKERELEDAMREKRLKEEREQRERERRRRSRSRSVSPRRSPRPRRRSPSPRRRSPIRRYSPRRSRSPVRRRRSGSYSRSPIRRR